MTIYQAEVVTAEKVASAVLHLALKTPEGYTWKTGQFAKLDLHIEGEDIFRLYSIASKGASETVDFFITRKPDGALSPKLHDLKRGERVLLDAMTGGTLIPEALRAGARNLWLLSTGSGVAPFLGIVSDEDAIAPFERVIVVHGARTWDDTGYVARHIARSSKLRLLCALTRQADAAIPKRIPAAIDDGTLEKFAQATLNPKTSRVMICGNPGFVTSILASLNQKGFETTSMGSPGLVLVENF